MSWIVSTSCAGPWDTISAASTTFQRVQEWLAYMLFAQCPQHFIVMIANASFIAASLVQNLCCTRKLNSSVALKPGWKFLLTSGLVGLLACLSTVTAGFQGWGCTTSDWNYDNIRETVFGAVEALAWIICTTVLINEMRSSLSKHVFTVRLWWFGSFLLSVLQLLSSIFRLSSSFSYDTCFRATDIYAILKFCVAVCLLAVTIDGGTGMVSFGEDELKEPLLEQKCQGIVPVTSGFANASFASKATFTWLTPLLAAGSKHSLQVGDVPSLAPWDTAENMHKLFKSKWPQGPNSGSHPVSITILRCFWPQILFTGFLQLVRSVIMYAGPALISSFTSYASGERASKYDGYVLVILLIVAKVIEVFCYHQFNFQSYKLGNNMRCAVITTLYQKGLRLSSAARQDHGIGQITNYMVIDAQQLSDGCLQIHLCWSLPFQVVLALLLLFRDIGVSALGGLTTMVLIAAFTLYNSNQQKFFQGHIMKMRDTRMKSITEVLAFMKVIKLQAWEGKFQEKVVGLRNAEFGWLSKFVISTAVNMFTLWNTLPFVSTVTYVTAVLLNAGLTTTKVFTAASIFRIVQEPIRNFPQAIISFAQVVVSLERLDKYMLSAELVPGAVTKFSVVDDSPVVMEKGYFAWDSQQEAPVLKGIDLNVKRGWLVTIVGTVGAGKSSLLSALLGEMIKVSGMAKTAGSVAYVSQTAWIQNATIEDNILFGSIKDSIRYREVIDACGLEPDLASMDYGDQTEIGEKGINMSGGQKQRIQLARAVYQNCDIYLLDDVFSAVDAHTGSHLFRECVLGMLKGKTILLVTHQVEFLSGADLVVVMKDGKIVQSGKYSDILSDGTDFAALVAAHHQAMDLVDTQQKVHVINRDIFKQDNKEPSEGMSMGQAVFLKDMSERSSSDEPLERLPTSDSFAEPRVRDGSARIIEEERREIGCVSWSAYWLYLTKAFGWATVIVLALNQSLWQACLLASDYWLAEEIPEDSNAKIDKKRFITVYVLLNVGAWTGVLVRVAVVAAFGLKTAQIFFMDMLKSIFHAPMSFFDTTPSGRILSRFSSDQTNLDFTLHFFFGGCISQYFSAIGVVIVISISTWPIIFLIIPLTYLYYWYQTFYITSSREITRLDAITKALLIYHFSETVAGIETIRCFRKERDFSEQNFDHVNMNMKMDFHNNTANEWLGLRLESIGTAILCTTAFLFVVMPENSIKTETVGLALSYALGLNAALFWTVWLSCTVENKMISVERIRQFTNIPSETVLIIPGCLPSTHWPMAGKIVSKRLKLRYRPSTPLVLKGVSFTINGGERVGIVGRTGSGKSTLILALFRLVEPAGGQLLIDDVEIASIGLHDLRSRLGIIPQDPVLFEGTIRMNLDPLQEYTDEEIWRGLEKCQLAQVVREKPEKLEASVTEYGGNWSVGQRQLLCFGRMLLKHSKILFLDEATASVDAQTDATIQGIIRNEFKKCTIVSIAHRIPTVMDSDKVLVMDAGRVKEFDSPSNLLQNSASLFASLVHEYSTQSEH